MCRSICGSVLGLVSVWYPQGRCMCRCELGIGIFRCVHLGGSLCLPSSVQVWQVFCLCVVCTSVSWCLGMGGKVCVLWVGLSAAVCSCIGAQM